MKKLLTNMFVGELVEFTEEENQGKTVESYKLSAKSMIAAILCLIIMIITQLL